MSHIVFLRHSLLKVDKNILIHMAFIGELLGDQVELRRQAVHRTLTMFLSTISIQACLPRLLLVARSS